MRVLYVEDDQLLAKSVELMLGRQGFDCQLAETGERAVAFANKNDYDLIILDIMLPDIDGYEVMERLRESRIETPVLVQSGLVERDSDHAGLGLGSTEFVAKPFEMDELTEAIQRTVALDISGDGEPGEAKVPAAGERASGAERRRHRRFVTLKGAKLVRGNIELDCVVLNMSHGGAALRLPRGKADCPPQFALRVDARTIRPCEVRWRYRDKVGVRFTDVVAGS